jgi:hypothetical protein
MRTLAEYILRGRTQAILIAVFAAAVPLLFWLSAATVALVTLRNGAQAGVSLLLFALIPAVGWWVWRQDPQIVIILVMTSGMALMLRSSASWPQTLLGGVALAVGLGLLMPVMFAELQQQLADALGEMYRNAYPEMLEQLGDRLDRSLTALVSGAFAASQLFMAVLSLFLARHWQAQVFNPGGFRQEFHELRMSRQYATGAVLLALLGPAMWQELLVLTPVLLVPLVFAGVALVHGYVAKRQLGVHWLFAFYAVAILMGPSTLFLLMMVAMVDSWINIRGRVSTE